MINPLKPNYDQLHEMYVSKRMSTIMIGSEIGVSKVTIGNWLRSYGIPLRTLREASYGNKRAYGHILTDEAKRKMSNTKTGVPSKKKGKPLTLEVRISMSKSNQARLGYKKWQGLLCDTRGRQRSRFSIHFRKKVLARDNYTCVFCKRAGGYLHADHIKSWNKYPELRFDINNCRTLCVKCHYEVTFKKPYSASAIKWGTAVKLSAEGARI